ncbi:conserved hypothetical protein [Cupriavidus taiwanensis]|nr:conserved hypothetical protein [Cupriavidus taiwanensis]SOZ25850.1 conserved hypothetical protein [Cupriavidus taiwanensis]SOZ45052.1 conserved hypothetical protein [Cupriavidus taiwanensis]
MPGYGHPVLAVWPEPWYETGLWQIYEYALESNRALRWRKAWVTTDNGHARAEIHADLQSAMESVNKRNPVLLQRLAMLDLDSAELRSLELKATKAIQAKERLLNEERLMQAEAIRRAENMPRPHVDELELPPESESFRSQLVSHLSEMPYLKVALVEGHPYRKILYRLGERRWSEPYGVTSKNAKTAWRSKISNGYGISGTAHWGKTKAAIRAMLLPRANQLLQLASVQRLLAEARARGQHVLVCNGYVFWYEAEGEIGWQVKQTATVSDSDGETLWHEGTILSKNHGRLVILPYIKECGELVQGHTRNAPGDGPAKPRHPEQYVELPFEILKDDLMIGLFGELPYE